MFYLTLLGKTVDTSLFSGLKVRFFQDIGIPDDAIGNMLAKFPPLLTYSLYKKIRPVVCAWSFADFVVASFYFLSCRVVLLTRASVGVLFHKESIEASRSCK